ncbi:MAG TPA: hypothetical protein EYN58_00675 [Candidatus Poseidoniales archaeon]|nr:MAG: hypothetical protein CXX81_26180 [Euryarchaeota archaeon]HHZ73701.1 hypothetical protein [Candidatus Poseidoniales archaeon]PXY75530.1 MAG: hypothetical protein CXX81_17940 [Euryarchaeota archaeon]PXY76737.1 MAG: hypothetical protein CXX81_13855 [Euryarchaeota archaeon]PXY79496.1 MAG: hypothetical protein CXX81_02120 [Euryarchaeota archaeon]
MVAKKNKPFNPFESGAAQKKKKPTFQRSREPQKNTPVHRSPTTLGPAPSAIKDQTSKPAIPQSHLKPKTTSEPVLEKEEKEPDSGDVILEDDIVEEPAPVEPVVDVSEEKKIDKSDTVDGPAVAVGKVRSLGLRQKRGKKESGESNDSDEVRVSGLIAESKALAADSGLIIEGDTVAAKDPISLAAEAARITLKETKSASEKAYEKRSKMIAKKRKTRASSAPSKRVVKLNRRKYMEFKVDVREIMEEENVDEEHRANLLGSTWAKGERKGIDAAIEFVEEKLEEQIISDKTAERIIKVLKGYRKVR